MATKYSATLLQIVIFAVQMKSKVNWDALGITTSLACAIHCALLPLFLTSLPIFGVELIENTTLEVTMIVIAFVIGTYSLYHGWKKHHHSFTPIIIFSIGFIFLVIKLFFVEYERWLLIPAVAGIIAAHILNYKSCRVHNHAHADDCNH
jgi:hypothetical protein